MQDGAVHARTAYVIVAHVPAPTHVINVMQEIGFALVFVHVWLALRHYGLVSVAGDFRRVPHDFFFVISFYDTAETLKHVQVGLDSERIRYRVDQTAQVVFETITFIEIAYNQSTSM